MIKNWFMCKGDYELVYQTTGTYNCDFDFRTEKVLVQFFYSKKENRYKLYTVDGFGRTRKIDNPALLIYEAKQNGVELP